MRNIVIIFLILTNYFVTAQISGNVWDENNRPIEFATIFNLANKSSAITNVNGFFNIKGKVGDSIRIQHVNCVTKEIRIKAPDDSYMLLTKNIRLGEITVTAKYAINIFKRSCSNTFNTFKHNNIYRGYFRYLSTIDKDTSQIINIDLDMVQKKRKDIDEGEKLIPYKVQESNEFKPSTPFCRTQPFFTYIDQIYTWANYLDNANYFKVEDSLYIKLYFIGKKQKMEVVIQKEDTCLVCVTEVSSAPLRKKTGEQLKINKSYWHIKYAYENGIGYLSEMSNELIFQDTRNEKNLLTFMQFYKTYDYKVDNMKRRPNGDRIYNNLWEPRFIKNSYEEKFWKRMSFTNNIPDSMESFAGLKIEKTHNAKPLKKSGSPRIRAYGIGLHKE